MAARSRLEIAKADIFKAMASQAGAPLTRSDIAQIVTENRESWRLAQRTTVSEFIAFLQAKGELQEYTLTSTTYNQAIKRFSWGASDLRAIALSIRRNSYLTHQSAVWFHSLTDIVPQKIFINAEQSAKPTATGKLSQHAIDMAFSRRPRTSNLVFKCAEQEIVVLAGKNTGRLGVISIQANSNNQSIDVTNIERTLIDITVRPNYAGGVFEVLEAYRRAKDTISTNKLLATLKKLDYVYPYHQSIGFLMQRAGFQESKYSLFSELPREFDFYLAHDIKSKEYDPFWRLFFPKGL